MKGKTKNKLWLLIEWIEGIKIKKLQKEDIKAIAKFYMQTNQSLNSYNKGKSFRLAKESIKNHQSMYDQIIRRLKETKKRIREDNVPEGLRTWMMKELIPKTYQRLEEYIKCDKKECWDKENMKQLLSQSDVGIHNIINQKGELYFIDFEYSGLDDISKYVADWALQPELVLSKYQENLLVEELCRDKFINHGKKYWRERLEDIKPLIHSKWCFIMSNRINEKSLRLQERVEKKIRLYYEMGGESLKR